MKVERLENCKALWINYCQNSFVPEIAVKGAKMGPKMAILSFSSKSFIIFLSDFLHEDRTMIIQNSCLPKILLKDGQRWPFYHFLKICSLDISSFLESN